ncbi:BTAD domain-containing putative transcriptional regulator [Kitasatospora sp. NPDC051853]|uniref:BTAD domain-containing putative transcriptional regulator n=1 Tax=Kitasatospora sp. NPDC051853 TaxID=3364058 RepID=UPI0037AD23A0
MLPPALPDACVERPGLVAVLDAAVRRRVTLLLAGPGWGKSTSLALWARSNPVAWLTVDEDHSDLGRFASDLLLALQPFLDLPEAVREDLPVLELARDAAAFVDVLAFALRGQAVLVLDDVHHLPEQSAAARLVERLCSRAPGGLRIVLTARREPALRLDRLRGRGHVSDLDAGPLRMDPATVAAFLSSALGAPAGGVAEPVHRCTDGWPAAVRLTADALRGTPPHSWPQALAAGPGPRLMLRYVREEVLAGESADALELMAGLARQPGVTGPEVGGPGAAEPEELPRAADDLVRRGLVAEAPGGATRVVEPIRRCLAVGTTGAAARTTAGRAGPDLAFHTLGGFRVVRDGRAVPTTEWKSAKARHLLKLLLARRGRPASREQLMDFLWPDEAPERLGNRLSVVLSAARAALLGDRRSGADGPLVADRDVILLDLRRIDVDVERFLEQAAEALDADRRGGDALALLSSAHRLYRGAFLADDLYAEWAEPLREEAHSEFLCVLHALVRQAERSGDTTLAIRFALRLLEHDAYDEQAHIGLIGLLTRAGRHGEARRRYGTYTAQMRAIGVTPSYAAGGGAPAMRRSAGPG